MKAAPNSNESNHKPKRLISLGEVTRRIGQSRWTVNRLIAEGKFPPPVRIGNRTMFEDGEVSAYVEGLLAARERSS